MSDLEKVFKEFDAKIDRYTYEDWWSDGDGEEYPVDLPDIERFWEDAKAAIRKTLNNAQG